MATDANRDDVSQKLRQHRKISEKSWHNHLRYVCEMCSCVFVLTAEGEKKASLSVKQLFKPNRQLLMDLSFCDGSFFFLPFFSNLERTSQRAG